MAALLEATGLVKRFGGTVALDGFDLAVAAGEIAGLVGHNGAGTSTFARVTAGLVTPDAGAVHVDGLNASRAAARSGRSWGSPPRSWPCTRRRRPGRTCSPSPACTACAAAMPGGGSASWPTRSPSATCLTGGSATCPVASSAVFRQPPR
jgi:energy-coupling factor transporter ATP-binding protein EcfA2